MNAALLPIFLVVLVDLLALTVILPLLPFYAESLGASPSVVGLLLSTFAVCQLLAGPPLGQWSDRVGRKPVLLVSQVGTFAGLLVLGFAQTLWMVFVARIIDGATAGNMTVAQAYIADVTRPEERAKAFGLVGIAFGIGFLLGPALSGYLAQFGPSYPIFTAAGLSAASIAATGVLLPAPHAATASAPAAHWKWRAYAEPLTNPQVGPRLWQFFALQFAISAFFSGFALFAERRLTHGSVPFGTREVGYTFAYLGLAGILFQGAIGPLVRRFGEAGLVQAGFAATAVSFVVLAGVRHTPSVLATMTLFAVGTALLRPSLTSLITRHTAAARQGMALGLMQSLQSLAQIVAPLMSGVFIDRQLLSAWALAGSAICVVGLFTARLRDNRAPTHA